MKSLDGPTMLHRIANGRTDLVIDYLGAGFAPETPDSQGVSLAQHCAYYGDVTALKYLLAHGVSLQSLGENLGLTGACFHGHWRLCEFLIESGADANHPELETGETPLHSALCTTRRLTHNLVLRVLLAAGANPVCATKNGMETGAFMRDCRTKGETPLHRAAAFGDEEAVKLLLKAGSVIDARDSNGDSPLSWASWYARPTSILRLLLYGQYRINPNNRGMEANLLGEP